MTGKSEKGPLTEAVYYILLSVFKPLHGYGIMQYVKEISGGRLQIGAGTLYGAISTLVEKGWIVECPDTDGGRKKEYQITYLGVEVVAAELARLNELVGNGNKVMNENRLAP